jgi:protein involved in polysaccharide export with SLBB domain
MKRVILLLLLVGCTATSPRQQMAQSQTTHPLSASPTVHIDGFVKRPGDYPWYPGMTRGDLLLQAGGTTLFAGKVRVHYFNPQRETYLSPVSDRFRKEPLTAGERMTVMSKWAGRDDTTEQR